MSNAYFCDKCGQAYPSENKTIIKAYRYNGDSRRIGGDLRLVSADLCPNCILKFDDWINSKIKKEENGNDD